MAKDVMCKNCTFLSNGWCEKTADSPVPDMVRDCRDFQQKTNADRIRAMSDEELAYLLEDFGACSRCRRRGNDCFPVPNTLEWLKQPVKEG